MGAGLVAVAAPVQGPRDQQGRQQEQGQRPEAREDSARPVRRASAAPAEPTIAVPITEAYQFGPR